MARISKKKRPSKRMIIVCGGEKTEPTYFKEYKRYLRTQQIHVEDIEVFKTPTKVQSPGKLLDFALEKSNEYDLDFASGDTVWCIFDYDDFNSTIQESIHKRIYKNIHKIISTRCFEIWYLLHFRYSTQFVQSTHDLETKLSDCLGSKYSKTGSYFHELLKFQNKAIHNAKRLEKYHHDNNTPLHTKDANPHTDVYKIVEYLNNFNE